MHALVKREANNNDAEEIKVRESAIIELGGLFAKSGLSGGKFYDFVNFKIQFRKFRLQV